LGYFYPAGRPADKQAPAAYNNNDFKHYIYKMPASGGPLAVVYGPGNDSIYNPVMFDRTNALYFIMTPRPRAM
jgi:hypothetical protein